MGSREKKGYPLIELIAVSVQKTGQRGDPRFERPANHTEGKPAQIGPGKTNYTDAAAAGRGSDGSNQISSRPFCHPQSAG